MLATLLGYTVARIADPFLFVLAWIIGSKVEDKFPVFLIAIAYGFFATIIFASPYSNGFVLMFAAGLLASAFWFSIFYATHQSKREKFDESTDDE